MKIVALVLSPACRFTAGLVAMDNNRTKFSIWSPNNSNIASSIISNEMLSRESATSNTNSMGTVTSSGSLSAGIMKSIGPELIGPVIIEQACALILIIYVQHVYVSNSRRNNSKLCT